MSAGNRTVYSHLFRPCRVGQPTMKNRMVMAPLTRCRADDNHVPTAIMAEYYGSRASMGMIITESIMVQRNYSGFAYEPGLYSAEQVESWRTITEAVHARGGLIAAQLYHPGRATTPANLTSGDLAPMGPSAVGIPPEAEQCIAQWSRDGKAQAYPQLIHAMTLAEIGAAVKFFTRAALNAMAAGFDAVEIHAGGGYLLDSFLRDSSNQRTDKYGGSVANRSRFLLEVLDAVAAAIKPDRVGVRLTPLDTFNGQKDSHPEALTAYVCEQLDARKIAFVDVVRGDPRANVPGSAEVWVRRSFGGAVLASHGYTSLEMAEQAIADGTVDAVLFGMQALANPDLVWRVLTNTPLNRAHAPTFFTRGSKGYIDYPICEPHSFSEPHVVAGITIPSEGSKGSRLSCQRATAMPMPAKGRPYVSVSQPLLLGATTMKNRLVMGPIPRQRCDEQQCPTAMMVAYYARRASYGLIISEPCEVQPGYHTYVRGAGISTKAQVLAWRQVTDAVHEKGGIMYCQLHHGGRATLQCNIASGTDTRAVGPTMQGISPDCRCPAAFAADGKVQSYPVDVVALSAERLKWIVQLYVAAAKNAMLAGFDGVEVHAGGGYLIDQFLRRCSNTRNDDYGGSPADRCRLLDEIVDAVAAAVGRRRVGVRISPTDLSKGMKDTDREVVTETVATHMGERKIAYITVASGSDGYYHGPMPASLLQTALRCFGGVVLCDDNISLAEAEKRIATDAVQGVCITLGAIANPDIINRAIHGAEPDESDLCTLFTHDSDGYDSYLTYAEMRKEARVGKARQSAENSASHPPAMLNGVTCVAADKDSATLNSPTTHKSHGAVKSASRGTKSTPPTQDTGSRRVSTAAHSVSAKFNRGPQALLRPDNRAIRRHSVTLR
ncbi:putative NADH:flavin oxidoreductase / NADH oxidase family [Leishmania shawi]|uniref:NADH:flavin oxidoreductase / NADH oxidase family n=1 Tax=Leishmania shawi TaxID=5680 RepID=A0AAW3C6J0_9TRYP